MWSKTTTLFVVSLFSGAIIAQDNDELVNNLINLRGQVEDLQAELKILQAEHQNSMSYLNTRKSELEANRDRKELQIKQQQQDLSSLQEKIKDLGLGSEQMIPTVKALIEPLKTNLQYGIPFKKTERLSVIEEIERSLEGRKITSQNAINRLWAFLEDEMRISRENAIYSQTIDLNGESLLVDIAKLGSVMMYFKTRDDRYGKAVRNNSNWQFVLIDDTEQVQQIETLFDSLKKQIRQGYFTLPLDLTAQG
ncbi:DUF3450 family protein [Marinicella sp. W31]|uniref:DUF3450 family protein n=1 Tax=Marinicella sp. W31 TaxID=3023713 RepID=UPI0037574192